jgi:hypothetical protein
MTLSETANRNLATVRAWLEAHASAEGATEHIPELWEPDADYYPVKGWPEARGRHGHDEIALFFREFWEAWSAADSEIDELVAIDDVRVLARTRLAATGIGSGLSLEGEVFHCCWLRNGRFIRVEDHLTEKGARHALGLEE